MNVLDDVCCDDIYSKKATAMNTNFDCDNNHFEFVDFTRESEAQDVINFFEEKSKNNFDKLGLSCAKLRLSLAGLLKIILTVIHCFELV
jgi:hypothetical protein